MRHAWPAQVLNHLIPARLIRAFAANETVVRASVYMVLMTVWWHVFSYLHIRVDAERVLIVVEQTTDMTKELSREPCL